MQTKFAALLVPVFTLVLGVSAPARAGLINGNFEQYSGGNNNAPSQLGNSGTGGYSAINGWTVGSGTYGFLMAPGTADTTGSYSPQFNNVFSIWGSHNGGLNSVPATSPDGGNFVALDAAAGYRGTGISQVLTGLTMGQQYYVSFDWASGQQYRYDGATNEGLQVSLGSQTQSTILVNNVSHGFTDWQRQTFLFTADGASETLKFLAVGNSPSGVPPVVLLDGVNFSAVPEPGSLALVGVGLVVTAAVRRYRRGTSAAI